MVWVLVPICLIAGAIIGLYLPLDVPAYYAKYLSVAILAVLDSVFGGVRAYQERVFNSTILLSGFFMNALLAALLAFLGDQMGVSLYIAAVFAFGVRIFQNLAIIRRYLFKI
jgi:small basic protein